MAIIQVGTEWLMGFSGGTITGYVPTTWTQEAVYNRATIYGESQEAISHIGKNKMTQMSGAFMCKSTAVLPKEHRWVYLKGPDDAAAKMYYVDKATPTYSNDILNLALTVLLPDSWLDGALWDAEQAIFETANFSIGTPTDVTEDIDVNSASGVARVENGQDAVLTPTTHWSFAAGTLTIKSAYLASVLTEVGDTVELWVCFDLGAPIVITITAVA